MNIENKKILDCTCSSRSIWFDKNNPIVLYTDVRECDFEERFGANNAKRHLHIKPDMIVNFEDMPFDDKSFKLVIFDPPHIVQRGESWMTKSYGKYQTKEEALNSIKKGVSECLRVLDDDGVLVFKWSEVIIPTREIIDHIGVEPLIYHKSGKKMNTNWMLFFKTERISK